MAKEPWGVLYFRNFSTWLMRLVIFFACVVLLDSLFGGTFACCTGVWEFESQQGPASDNVFDDVRLSSLNDNLLFC